MTTVMTVAGVELDGEDLSSLAVTILCSDIPIIDASAGTEIVPADDLVGAVALQLGLDPRALVDLQRSEIESLIRLYTES